MIRKIIIISLSGMIFTVMQITLLAQPKEMSQEEYELIHDQYAVMMIQLLMKYEELNAEVDSLKLLSEEKDSEIERLQSELYALVDATEGNVNSFRRKFEETEKRISNRTGTPRDARTMYYDEIISSKIRCLPEFADRFASMRKQMTDWEGIQTEAPIVTQETPQTPEGTYLVVKGDCLWRISTLKYGSPYYWPAIWEANKNGVINRDELYDYRHKAITDPNLIYPGQVLKIPPLNKDQSIIREEFKEKIKKFRKQRILKK